MKCHANKMKRQRAVLHDKMIENLLQSICAEREEHDFEVAIENPVGSLRKRPFMQEAKWDRMVDMRTIDYCAYGAEQGCHYHVTVILL